MSLQRTYPWVSHIILGRGLSQLLKAFPLAQCLGGSTPSSPLEIISLMQKHRTKTPRLAVIITCKYFQTIRSGRGSVCSLGQSYTGFRLFTTRLISCLQPTPLPPAQSQGDRPGRKP